MSVEKVSYTDNTLQLKKRNYKNSTNDNEFIIKKTKRIWEKVLRASHTTVKSETGKQDYIIGKACVWLRDLFLAT